MKPISPEHLRPTDEIPCLALREKGLPAADRKIPCAGPRGIDNTHSSVR